MTEEELETIRLNSFVDFHTKGFNYLCVKRSPQITEKIYFFDGDVDKLPEVVNPHDHRYAFKTEVLSGCMSNSTYEDATSWFDNQQTDGKWYEHHQWSTPLNGGIGAFGQTGIKLLREVNRSKFKTHGGEYWTDHRSIHTIRMEAPDTVIRLEQYESRVNRNESTSLFIPITSKTPNLDGLYNKPTTDQVLKMLERYEALK